MGVSLSKEDEDEVKRMLLSLLQTGILRIRAFAHSHFGDRCAVEADHIHNLPGLISNPRLDLLMYYWDRERLSFIKKVPDSDAFETDWFRLGELLEQMKANAAAG